MNFGHVDLIMVYFKGKGSQKFNRFITEIKDDSMHTSKIPI